MRKSFLAGVLTVIALAVTPVGLSVAGPCPPGQTGSLPYCSADPVFVSVSSRLHVRAGRRFHVAFKTRFKATVTIQILRGHKVVKTLRLNNVTRGKVTLTAPRKRGTYTLRIKGGKGSMQSQVDLTLTVT